MKRIWRILLAIEELAGTFVDVKAVPAVVDDGDDDDAVSGA